MEQRFTTVEFEKSYIFQAFKGTEKYAKTIPRIYSASFCEHFVKSIFLCVGLFP